MNEIRSSFVPIFLVYFTHTDFHETFHITRDICIHQIMEVEYIKINFVILVDKPLSFPLFNITSESLIYSWYIENFP